MHRISAVAATWQTGEKAYVKQADRFAWSESAGTKPSLLLKVGYLDG